MAKPIVAITYAVQNTATTPTIQSINSDPTTGGGLAAPIGSLAMRTDVGSLYVKTGSATTAWTKIPSETNLSVTNYTATGAEGSDFNVTITGGPLPTDVYNLYWSPKGVTQIPVIDLPDTLSGDRTTTTFRVITSSAPALGDIFSFLIFQA